VPTDGRPWFGVRASGVFGHDAGWARHVRLHRSNRDGGLLPDLVCDPAPAPPATASVGMLLVPLIGIVSSALLIGEPFGLRELMSVALTLGGVTLALTGSHRRASVT
jgi:hypothetical protein